MYVQGYLQGNENGWVVTIEIIVLTQDHMEKYRNIFFSEAIALIEPKLCINHWKVLYKLLDFYVDQNFKMTTTAGQSLHRTNWFFL